MFDETALLKGLRGNVKLLTEVLELFLEECPTWKSEIKKAGESGDSKELGRLAHAVRGASGNLGAGEVAELAGRLEDKIRVNDLNDVDLLVKAIDRDLGLLQQDLERLVRKLRTNDVET